MMEPKQIFIHLGFPKTGSTTIQAMLELNAKQLEHVVHVSPKDQLTYQLRKNALRYMLSGKFYWWKICHRRALRQFRSDLQQISQSKIIISDENMIGFESGRLFDNNIASLYKSWLMEFDSALSDFKVTYIVYTRDTTSWQKSAHSQAFKMRRTRLRFKEWAKTHNSMSGPDDIIAVMRGVLADRLHVFDMKEELAEQGWLGANVLRVAGVPEDIITTLQQPPKKNESLPESAIEFLHMMNDHVTLSPTSYRRIMRLVAQNPGLFHPGPPKKS